MSGKPADDSSPDQSDDAKHRPASTKSDQHSAREATQLNVVVTVADHALSRVGEIGQQLRECGMTIETPLEELGQYIGMIPRSCVAQLSAIRGVTAVEELGEVRLPPSPNDPQ